MTLLNNSDFFTKRFGKIGFLEPPCVRIVDVLRDPVSKAVLRLHPAAQVVVPPHKTAVCSPAGDSLRDNPIRVIGQYGRIAWQKKTGYGLRKYAKLAMQRVKRIFGNTFKARQLAEAFFSKLPLRQ